MILEKNMLRLTKEGEQGTYILKPVPSDLKKAGQVPANEHLTMQIAGQDGINTAANAMIFFRNGDSAYITKRFDVKEDGVKAGKEDFASLSGKSRDNAGPDFKYQSSYEECGFLIRKFVPAWRVEIEKYFSLVVFNFLFSNGDAHLKNFPLLESSHGDYLLSPAYDLINTACMQTIHILPLKKVWWQTILKVPYSRIEVILQVRIQGVRQTNRNNGNKDWKTHVAVPGKPACS